MAEHLVDLTTWPRAAQFWFFRSYDRPHYAVTSRIDMSSVMTARKDRGLAPYRASLFAIGAGINGVAELCMRFRGDTVVRHDGVELSMTVPLQSGSYNFAYVPFDPDYAAFNALCSERMAAARTTDGLRANVGARDDLAYLSCMPWLDYSSINNALPGPHDCIPRISWGKIVQNSRGWDMAMTIEVHHALVDGQQVGDYFATVQSTLDRLGTQ